jgi:capsular exopolysaccharide synthesis family protein
MTTLPQAAALRLPRPAFSNLPVAAVPVGGAIGYPQQSSASAMTGADVWRVIRSNLWLIILLLIVSAAAGYGMNFWLLKYHPRYTAQGKVLVLGTVEDTAAGMLRESSSLDSFSLPMEVRLHTAMLKDSLLFTKVLQNPNTDVRTTLWFKRFSAIQDAKQDLADQLDVTSTPDSRLIDVSMTDSDPNSCKVIVQSVVDQYIKNEQEKNRDRQYSLNQDLEQQRITQEDKVKLIDGDISDLQADLNTAGITGTMNKISMKDLELEELLKDLQGTTLEWQAATQQYNAINAQIEADPDQVPAIEEQVDKDPKVMQLRQIQNNVDMSLAQDAGGTMLSDSPTLQSAQKNKTMIDQRLASAEAQARSRYKTEIVEEMSERVDGLKNQAASMQNQIATIKSETQQDTEHLEQLNLKQAERAADQTKLEKIDDQLDQIAAYNAKHDVAGVEWASQPELPEIPSFPKLGITMTASITLGLLIALGIAFLRELLDTSIRSPRDISRVGSLNLLGMVPHEDDDPQSAGARLPVVIFEAPHSMMAEQLRQVRTRLQHSSSLDTSRSILVTSPSPGDGKSTIACNLASGLALNGRRILLVDANFRRPELHRVFNLANEQGFSDVLNNMELFEHAVQETQVPNLFVLPSGHKPTNTTELVESQLLVDFIERSLEEFDHVIFDSGPLLFVSETVALAPRVDGVVTVVRARINTRGVLSRMRDMLKQIKAEHLGVVLNAVRAQGGGYYGRNIRTYYEYQNNGGRGAA